jgi:hypothetical protein
VVYGSGLENRRRETVRGFESHPFRHGHRFQHCFVSDLAGVLANPVALIRQFLLTRCPGGRRLNDAIGEVWEAVKRTAVETSTPSDLLLGPTSRA